MTMKPRSDARYSNNNKTGLTDHFVINVYLSQGLKILATSQNEGLVVVWAMLAVRSYVEKNGTITGNDHKTFKWQLMMPDASDK